jgi:hypothetical protein
MMGFRTIYLVKATSRQTGTGAIGTDYSKVTGGNTTIISDAKNSASMDGRSLSVVSTEEGLDQRAGVADLSKSRNLPV